ncbi:MAG TPA: trigger factor [Microbacteriaceae bacterium]|nr:trigger factor [Microbacteriaceae bacterium]
MSETTVEKLNPTRAKLSVSVTQDELEPHIKEAYKTIANQVSIPGFRKGKVPAPIIDQRVGREAVIEQAVNHALDDLFNQAVTESDVKPMGRPSADVETWLDPKDPESKLVVVFEVEVRPDFKLPKYSAMKITVDDIVADADAVEEKLDELRQSFGDLVTVDRGANKGDFVELDLTAKIDDVEVDQASGVSYEVGSGTLLEGMDVAVETLTAGETTTFTSQLLGGEHEGQDAEVEVTITAVKERELPEADDEFAKLASEFDTIGELRKSIAEEIENTGVFQQGAQAREILIEKLLEKAAIPVSQELVDEEVHRHLEGEGRLEDDVHRAEVEEQTSKQLQMQLLLDAIVEAESVEPTQDEISQYIVNSAGQYGMDPQQFVQALTQAGQIQVVLSEVTRNKALAVALSKVNVVDKAGNKIDLSDYTRVDEASDEEAEADETAKDDSEPETK